jgi:hypothetical protein
MPSSWLQGCENPCRTQTLYPGLDMCAFPICSFVTWVSTPQTFLLGTRPHANSDFVRFQPQRVKVMDEKARKLKEKREKAEAELRELKRKEKQHANAVAEQLRKDDTRRKIIDGAHMQTRALSNPGIAAMLQQDREDNLEDDRDRLLFGLPVLSEEEKNRRSAMRNAGASSALSDSSRDAPASDLRLVSSQ